MVVLAQAQGPLPFPMTVEGDPVTGDGLNFYQFVLPMDRSVAYASDEDASATTKPTTNPARDNRGGGK